MAITSQILVVPGDLPLPFGDFITSTTYQMLHILLRPILLSATWANTSGFLLYMCSRASVLLYLLKKAIPEPLWSRPMVTMYFLNESWNHSGGRCLAIIHFHRIQKACK